MKPKSTSLILPILLVFAGPCLSALTWAMFFGGSKRDSTLTWVIMDTGFFGGIAMLIGGAIWLAVRARRS